MKKRVASILAVIAFGLVALGIIKITVSKNGVQKAAESVLFLELYNRKGEMLGTGSGFLIDENTLVTNYHVIESVYKIIARTADGTKSVEINSVLSYEGLRDLALLDVEEPLSVYPLKLADSDSVKQGDKVYAVGYPLGIANTLSDGLISAFYQEGKYKQIQFSAPISPGSSGGVLLNEKGKVIGVLCASYGEGQNLNLAIPSNDILPLIDRINRDKKTSLSELYFHTLTGYAAYTESEAVEFGNLCSNYGLYEDKLISTQGYVIYTDGEEFVVAPGATYQAKTHKRGGNDFNSWDFDDPFVLVCIASQKANITYDHGIKPSVGDNVLVCGYPVYLPLPDLLTVQDILFVSIIE
ncbi:MAG: S1C family serine protease [bacterium]|nr:S1C family serine protease [bacterium]